MTNAATKTNSELVKFWASRNDEVWFHYAKARSATDIKQQHAHARTALMRAKKLESDKAKNLAARRTKGQIAADRDRLVAAIAKAGSLRLRDLQEMDAFKKARYLSSDLAALVKAGRLSKEVQQTYEHATTHGRTFGGSVAVRRNIAHYSAT